MLHLFPQCQHYSYTKNTKHTLHIQKLLGSPALTTGRGCLYDCNTLSESSSMIKKEHLTREEHNRGLTFLRLQVSHWPLGAPCGGYGSHFKTSWLSAGRGLSSRCTSSRIQWPARCCGESDYNNTLFAYFFSFAYIFLGTPFFLGKFIIFFCFTSKTSEVEVS